MNTQSIQATLSPFLLSFGKMNQSHRFHAAGNPTVQLPTAEKDQPTFIKNPQKLVENQLLNSVEKAIGSDKVSATKADDSEFNPEKLADKVLNFVTKAYGQLQNNDPNFDKAAFFSQIKQGLDTGFSDAKDALGKLGLLDEQTQQSIDAAFSKIQDGLSKLEAGDQTTPAAAASVLQAQGFAAQSSQSAEIKVVTKEGDIIKIKLSQSASVSQGAVNVQQDGGSATAFQASSTNSSSMSVSVEGNLNEDEQKALKNLLKEMDTVGKDFFNGNIKDAFEHTQKIGLDSEQIAGFSMSLSSSRSIQAVAAYQQVAAPDQQVEADKIKQATDFFSHAKELLASAQSALKPFENPLSVFNALFSGVNQVGNDQNAAPSLQQIIKPLGETLLNNGNAVAA